MIQNGGGKEEWRNVMKGVLQEGTGGNNDGWNHFIRPLSIAHTDSAKPEEDLHDGLVAFNKHHHKSGSKTMMGLKVHVEIWVTVLAHCLAELML